MEDTSTHQKMIYHISMNLYMKKDTRLNVIMHERITIDLLDKGLINPTSVGTLDIISLAPFNGSIVS
jgi:hypothetical protein